MGKLENTQKRATLIPFLLGVLFFGTIFFLRPKIGEILKFRKDITKEKETLARLTQKVAILEGLNETELEEKTKILLGILPAEMDISTFLLTVKNLSFQAEIPIKEIRVGLDESKGFSGSSSFFTIWLKLEASLEKLEKINNFIELVENSAPLMRVDSLTIYERGKEKGGGEVDLKIKAFYLLPPKELGAIDAPVSLLNAQEEKTYLQLSSRFTYSQPPTMEELELQMGVGKSNPFSF